MNANTLCSYLGERYELKRTGQGLDESIALEPPLLYTEGMQPRTGQILVMKTQDLPSASHCPCVFICVGGHLPKSCSRWMGEVVHVAGEQNLTSVFNQVQAILTKVIVWEKRMLELVASGSLADMARESLPLFENRITVVDYDLQMLIYCTPREDGAYEVIDGMSGGEPVPASLISQTSEYRTSSISNRSPYFVEDESGHRSYCMNMYMGETYAGSCSLFDEHRPFTVSDLELFKEFCVFARQKLLIENSADYHSGLSFADVFRQLLEALPVSKRNVSRAMSLKEQSLGEQGMSSFRWFCMVLRSVGRTKVLSDRYLCETIEKLVPLSTALPFEGSIVVFSQLREGEHRAGIIDSAVRPLLADLHLEAGVSRTFVDIFHARDYYLQACCAIETGVDCGEDDVCHMFGANVLAFMLASSCGGFGSEMLVTPGLVKLARRSSSGIDFIETLRCYLDNECSMTPTARQLYVHRSTLADRLSRIERYVDLSTPEKRLYIRMCLALEDTSWRDNADVL